MDYSQSRLIYEYYASRIRFGYYRKGDVLPSAGELCEKFGISRQTIRRAFVQLNKEGYVDVSPGRKSAVAYDVSDQEIQQSLREYFLARKDMMPGVNQSLLLVLRPLLEEGCRRLKAEEMEALGRSISQPGMEASEISLRCCYVMMKSLDNPLAMNLYNEALLYYRFPCFQKNMGEFAYGGEHAKAIGAQMISSCRNLDKTGFLHGFFQLQKEFYNAIMEYLASVEDQKDVPEPALFQWTVYRDRPQCCYTLVSNLIRHVLEGGYAEGDYLPSYGAIAEEYSVSFSTVRRSVELLSALGVVHTVNGVGIRVMFSAPDVDKLCMPAVSKNFQMFFNSIQIVYYTCDSVIGAVFSLLKQEEKRALKSCMEEQTRFGGLFYLVFDSVIRLLRIHSLMGFGEVCDKLYEFLLWGYPFIHLAELDETAGGASRMLAEGLERDVGGLYSRGVKALVGKMYRTVMKALNQE